MAFVQSTINSTDPVDASQVSAGAGRIRNLAAAVKERLASAFVAPDTDPMVLKAASMPTNIVNLTLTGQINAATAAISGAVTVGSIVSAGAVAGASALISGAATVGTDLDVGGDLTVVGAFSAPAIPAASLTGTIAAARLPATIPTVTITDLTATNPIVGTVASSTVAERLVLAGASLKVDPAESTMLNTGGAASYVTTTPPVGGGTTRYINVTVDGVACRITCVTVA